MGAPNDRLDCLCGRAADQRLNFPSELPLHGLFSKNTIGHCDGYDEQGSGGENGVVRERCSQAWDIVARPFIENLP